MWDNSPKNFFFMNLFRAFFLKGLVHILFKNRTWFLSVLVNIDIGKDGKTMKSDAVISECLLIILENSCFNNIQAAFICILNQNVRLLLH